ncbi:unnamed protein product [Caretta caretta]
MAEFPGSEGIRRCVEHQKALTLFCEEDQTPICVVCHLSQTHRAHTVVPIKEDNQEYKDKIQLYLKILKEERENFQGFKLNREKKSQEYLKQRGRRFYLNFRNCGSSWRKKSDSCWLSWKNRTRRL